MGQNKATWPNMYVVHPKKWEKGQIKSLRKIMAEKYSNFLKSIKPQVKNFKRQRKWKPTLWQTKIKWLNVMLKTQKSSAEENTCYVQRKKDKNEWRLPVWIYVS